MNTKFWLEKSEGKRPLGIPRHRWEDNIRMNLWEMGWEVVDWMHLYEDRDQLRGSCERGNGPSGSTKGKEFLD
jgi:hypothetical protein